MKEHIIGHAQQQFAPATVVVPGIARPVWHDQQMACDQCRYNDQDIDTFPCAKCHTRN